MTIQKKSNTISSIYLSKFHIYIDKFYICFTQIEGSIRLQCNRIYGIHKSKYPDQQKYQLLYTDYNYDYDFDQYSGYSAFTGGLERSAALKNKSKKNALWLHCTLYHNSNPVQFSMSVASTHTDPPSRKTREGVTIIAGDQDVLLNSKQEFLQEAVPSQRTQYYYC